MSDESIRHRFWLKVKIGNPEECWPWTGYVGPSGHGRTTHKAYSMITSRKAWILTHGETPHGFCVNHRCDNPLCCNPAHLYLGTRADNMIDRFGKTPAAERRARGRPTILGPEDLQRYFQMRREGLTMLDCANKLGVNQMTIRRLVTRHRQQILEKYRSSLRP